MKYQAVIFDLFGTLVDIFSVREYDSVLVEMAAYLNIPFNDFHQIWRQTAPERAIGEIPSLEENIDFICRELKFQVSDAQMKSALRVRFEYVTRALTPRSDALETLAKLKADGYKIGLISNCSMEPPVIWPDTPFAPFFDVAIFSSTAHLKKPDPRIFQMAAAQLKVAPQECLYIGDGGDYELEAAAALGMMTVLIRATHEDSTDALRPNVGNTEAFIGPRIASLQEVLNLVK